MQQFLQKLNPSRPRAVVAGAVLLGMMAGLVAALFLTVTGEPRIEDAIRIEEAAVGAEADLHATAGHDHGGDEPLVSRAVQRGPGLFGAYALSGAGFGLFFSMAFLTLGRGRPDVFRRALVAGVVLAGAFTVAPWLKYPPNPPAVGDPATVGDRQRIYVLLIVLTLVLAVGAIHLARRLRERSWSEPARMAAVGGAVVVVMLTMFGLLPPAPDAVEVPATLVWQFRVASLGGNLLLWTVLTLGFGVIASQHRSVRSPVLSG